MSTTVRTPLWYHGGIASSMAACCTHPLDLLKVHLQTQKSSKLGGTQLAVNIVKSNGLRGLYNGISASLGRQLTYSTTRFALYDVLRPVVAGQNENPALWQKMILASAGGFFGGIVGTPCDMVNVRMQNDIKLPKEARRNYKHVFDGLYTVFKTEGTASLFKGVQMATIRAILITNGQIAFYDQFKQFLLTTRYFNDNMVTHFTASLMAGAVATAMTQPADVLKTRLMNAKPNEYKSILHCVRVTAMEGPTGFFKGFTPAFIRLGPQTILTWLFKEQLRLNFGKLKHS